MDRRPGCVLLKDPHPPLPSCPAPRSLEGRAPLTVPLALLSLAEKKMMTSASAAGTQQLYSQGSPFPPGHSGKAFRYELGGAPGAGGAPHPGSPGSELGSECGEFCQHPFVAPALGALGQAGSRRLWFGCWGRRARDRVPSGRCGSSVHPPRTQLTRRTSPGPGQVGRGPMQPTSRSLGQNLRGASGAVRDQAGGAGRPGERVPQEPALPKVEGLTQPWCAGGPGEAAGAPG